MEAGLMARRGIGRGAALPRPVTGGTAYNPKRKVPKAAGGATAGGLTQPPALTYDPAIEAQRRAAKRGLSDTLQDVKTGRHYEKRDLKQALQDIKTTTSRKRGDLNRTAFREQRKLSHQEGDLQTRAGRAHQDFDTQLASIGRQFAQLGQRQAEGANAAGVNNAGTRAASASARQRNQSLAETPIHTGRQRLDEDLYTALSRIGTGRGELEGDTARELKQLHVDRDRDRRLSRRETGRDTLDLKREEQRARREAAIADVDLITQEIYQARQNRPGAFTKTGNKRRR